MPVVTGGNGEFTPETIVVVACPRLLFTDSQFDSCSGSSEDRATDFGKRSLIGETNSISGWSKFGELLTGNADDNAEPSLRN